ncbi:DUF1266 domain-containing protein [Burkholderia contaminans]|uniref:DUF1266 domain-containing protein n=1 Tax=Burkholderia contaminans TaxID=488447 RepID=UPI001CF3E475|nr:DUF1266 domain-containing protein [Burkholderia contaminans]MCA8100133.1 DUF1266 domain-containing protein [Burkholderia contaminans]
MRPGALREDTDAMSQSWWFNLFVIVFAGGWMVRFARQLRPQPLPARRRWALALAQPFAAATRFGTFHVSANLVLTDAMRARYRPQLLHQMGLRTDASGDDARAHLARTLEAHWFRADLQELLPTDDPRAALAFACARMAFLVRMTMLMGWVEPQVAWRVLLLNAQRAQDCFASWEDFGRAFIEGRRQWVAAFRADPFGQAFDDQALAKWLASRNRGWRGLPWPGPAAFSPVPAAGRTPERVR